ncbi:MAG: recombinase family protein [Paracoccaceae bacterium]
MKQVLPKSSRCAVYTRKSTEHNLDLAFNSLDAQREACEAYVKSQAHEGWTLLADRYDDGGLSGASLQRPALQQLLADIRGGKVDIIVVYKVDRLTRALADFAKLVEEFDANNVAFVSVTQSFNTTSSMGRLTLNVLLSFAQFEREVIGERVRDKIAASKRKGIWVGGPVALGYRSVGKSLVVMPEEAEIVRTIFARYLIVGSIRRLIDDLYQQEIYPRGRISGDGNQGTPTAAQFMVGPLGHILKNRFYVGEVVYKGEVHAGQHQPIVDRNLFEAVQQRLYASAVTHKTGRRNTSFLLAGYLYDDSGNRMTPSHANKAGVRYRYYVSQAVLQNRKGDAGTISRVAAPDIETLVVAAVRRHLRNSNPKINGDGIGGTDDSPRDRDTIVHRVERIVLHAHRIEITLREQDPDPLDTGALSPGGASEDVEKSLGASAPKTKQNILTVPWTPKPGRLAKGITSEPRGDQRIDPHARAAILSAIGKARLWVDDLMAGRVRSFEEIARHECKGERYIRMLAPLAFVSPKIVTIIAEGSAPAGMTVSGLARSLSHSWAEQEKILGLA